MLIWGGTAGSLPGLSTGGRYDPLTDSWTPTTMSGAPPPYQAHWSRWTGQVMQVTNVYGSWSYDPILDTWLPIPKPPAGVWTGSRWIDWPNGTQYDPATNTYSPISMVGAPPTYYAWTATLWTGTLIVVWGSNGGPGYRPFGARYNPTTDTWTPMSMQGGPPGRNNYTYIWTGNRFVVWGGYDAYTGRDV